MVADPARGQVLAVQAGAGYGNKAGIFLNDIAQAVNSHFGRMFVNVAAFPVAAAPIGCSWKRPATVVIKSARWEASFSVGPPAPTALPREMGAPSQYDVRIDDIVLSTQRIGCN